VKRKLRGERAMCDGDLGNRLREKKTGWGETLSKKGGKGGGETGPKSDKNKNGHAHTRGNLRTAKGKGVKKRGRVE